MASRTSNQPRGGAASVLITVAAIAIVAACGWRVSSAIREANALEAAGQDRSTIGSTAARQSTSAASDLGQLNVTGGVIPGSAAGAFPSARPPGYVARQSRRDRQMAHGEPPPPSHGVPAIPIDVARVALDFVGTDPLAEQMWIAAINDPRLTPDQRSNLIEDLNENGFVDPDHVQPHELPIVLNRIALIEQLAPDAMDDTNLAAFAEAYKDLTAIADQLTREMQASAQAQADAQAQAQATQAQAQAADQPQPTDPTVTPDQPATAQPTTPTVEPNPPTVAP